MRHSGVERLVYCSHNIPMIKCEEHRPREDRQPPPMEATSIASFNDGTNLVVAELFLKYHKDHLFIKDDSRGWVPLKTKTIKRDHLI